MSDSYSDIVHWGTSDTITFVRLGLTLNWDQWVATLDGLQESGYWDDPRWQSHSFRDQYLVIEEYVTKYNTPDPFDQDGFVDAF